jgi:hypothetical protein
MYMQPRARFHIDKMNIFFKKLIHLCNLLLFFPCSTMILSYEEGNYSDF